MSSINLPKGRDLATEYSKTLSAQIGIMPSMLAAEQQYGPLQSANQLGNVDRMLFGTPGGSYASQIYTPAIYNKGGKYSYGAIPPGTTAQIAYSPLPANGRARGGNSSSGWSIPGISGAGGGGGLPGMGGGFDGGVLPGMSGIPGMGGGGGDDFLSGLPGLGGLFGGGDGPKKRLITPGGYQSVMHELPAQRGLLDIYGAAAPVMGDIERGEASRTRSADIGDVMRLGPEALQAIMASDPETAKLIQTLTQQAQSELERGTDLDPSQLRLVQQGVRAGQAARGMGFGRADNYGEVLGLSQFGQDVRNQRRSFAGGVTDLRQRFLGDPFQRVLGRSGANSVAGAQGATGQALGISGAGGPLSMLNPESSYANGVNGGNWDALVSAALGNAKMKNDLIGAGISAVGNIAGGAMSFI